MHILYFFLPYVFVLERSIFGTRYLVSIERKIWEFAWESGSDGSVVRLFMLAFLVKCLLDGAVLETCPHSSSSSYPYLIILYTSIRIAKISGEYSSCAESRGEQPCFHPT